MNTATPTYRVAYSGKNQGRTLSREMDKDEALVLANKLRADGYYAHLEGSYNGFKAGNWFRVMKSEE